MGDLLEPTDVRQRTSHSIDNARDDDIERQPLRRFSGDFDNLSPEVDTPVRPYLFSPQKRAPTMISSATAFIPTRRELILLVSFLMIMMFTHTLSFSRTDEGSRSLRFSGQWPFQGSVDDGIHPGKTAAAFGKLTVDDEDAEWKQLLEEGGLLAKLYGTNDLGSIKYEGVGRWKEVTVNDSLSRWEANNVPRTEIVTHAPGMLNQPFVLLVILIASFCLTGWTIYRNLYLLNGTWYIVTDNPSEFPLLRMMTSSGAEIWNDQESIRSREPTDKDMKLIFPSEAKRLFGNSASRVEGTTWTVNDPPQFLDHYYQ